VHCSWSEARFERRLEDALPPRERKRFDDHLSDCRDCRALFDELSVVDAILRRPRTVEPTAAFTAATMREVARMSPPVPAARVPWSAYLVSYIVAAWLWLGAAYLIDPAGTASFGRAILALARTVADAVGGVTHAALHLGDRGELSTWTTYAGGIVLVDLMLAVALVWLRRRGWARERT
jgi:predicted anti-sigma-YlaC factor YlaD